MRKLITVLVLFLSLSTTKAQQNDNYLPKFTPPSTEGFNFTKYGNIDVDDFNGKVNHTISLYNYKVGKIDLPININYYGTGVKLRDVPSQVGMNFNLDAGGIITREIKGIADEYANQRLSLNYTQLNALNQGDCSYGAEELRNIMESDLLDKEKDIFIVKFQNNFAKFYFNGNFEPVFISNDNELKIEVNGNQSTNYLKFFNNYSFTVIANDGTKYFFGGLNCTEITTIRSLVNGNVVGDSGGVTSFYLNKIQAIDNTEIYLEYETTQTYHYTLDSNYSKTRLKYNEFNPSFDCPSTSLSQSSSFSMTQLFTTPLYLKKVFSNRTNLQIVCNRSNFANAYKYKKVLHSLEILSGNTLINKISFQYYGLAPTLNPNRFFLEKIKFNDHLTSQTNPEEYNFVYNDIENIPLNRYNDIDLLGYFNNSNNFDLTPFFSDESQNNMPNRNSSFEYASKGVLKKIIYPTKGYTEFDYEQIPISEKNIKNYSIMGYILQNNLNDSEEGIGTISDNGQQVFSNGFYVKSHAELPYAVTLFGNTQQVFNNPVVYSQNVKIKIRYNTVNFHNSNPKVKLKITDLTNSSLSVENQYTYNNEINYYFKSNHNYKIELDLVNFPNKYSDDFSSFFFAEFSLFEGYKSEKGIGLRLKRTKDYASNLNEPIINRYYYKPINKINDINADAISMDNLQYNKQNGYGVLICTSNPFSIFPSYHPYTTTTLNSNIDYLENMSLDLYYNVKFATISNGGDNFENGGVQKQFATTEKKGYNKLFFSILNNYNIDQANITYPISHPSNNPIMGKLINEKKYVNKNNSILKIQEEAFTYNSQETMLNSINVIGGKVFTSTPLSSSCSDINKIVSNYNIQYYHDFSYNFKLESKKSVNYLEPVPLNLMSNNNLVLIDDDIILEQEVDDTPYKKIITTQTYEYGTLKGLPTAITTSTSDTATVNKTVNTYVNTASTLPNIPSTQAALYTSLLAQNRVGEPVQVQQFENSELLSTQRTLFKNWTIGSTNKILPEKIQLSKGLQPLEDKALFYNYDTNFNPAVMGYAAAPKTKYIFNTDGLVVAKIENYTGTETTFPLITGNIDNTNCALQTQNPTAFVTVFTYDLSTKKLLKITDSKCQNTFYVYDTLQRLQFIKDHDGNIVKEFDQQFKPQN